MRLRRAAVAGVIKENRRAARREWYKHPTLMRFLEDHAPLEWDAIRHCKTGYYRIEHDELNPDTYRTYSKGSCHRIPWCIMCTKSEQARRVFKLRESLERCTPAGHEPRPAHIVITAMVHQDGTGWGMPASRDLDRFYAGAHQGLTWAYGEGLGWKGSYQDVGERPFKKRNPHIDLTLNGWRLQDGQAVKVDHYNLKDGGHARLCARLEDVFTEHFDAWGWKRQGPRFVAVNNVDLHGFRDGFSQYHHAMKYQLREVINLRQITYSHDQQKVWWHDYKNNVRVEYAVNEFLAGIAEYQARLGQWGYEPAKQLHRGVGHLAKAEISKTQKAMGGITRAHEKGCSCSQCGDWELVFLEEVQQTVEETGPLQRP